MYGAGENGDGGDGVGGEVLQAEEEVPFRSLEFNLLTQDEIMRSSVAEINDPNFDAPAGGLYDERMGVLESQRRCRTCHQTRMECPGHMGHIVLYEPVYHPLLSRPLLHFVRCLCLECKQVLVTPEGLASLGFVGTGLDPIQRVETVAALLVKRMAGGMCTRRDPRTGEPCMTLISKFTFSNDQLLISVAYQEEPAAGQARPRPRGRSISASTATASASCSVGVQYRAARPISAARLRDILVHVPEVEYMALLGMSAPSPAHWPVHYILGCVPVIPPSARPWVLMYGGMKADDDLTYKYADIIRYSNALTNPRLTASERASTVQMLTFQVKTLFDNTKNLSQHPNRRPLFCIKRRLGGKEGRVRKNLSGKRSIWTARTVIGPDPNLRLDELALPPLFAQKLTFPERVTAQNMAYLQSLIAAGRANYVVQHPGEPADRDAINPGSISRRPGAGQDGGPAPDREPARRNLAVFYGNRDREEFGPCDVAFFPVRYSALRTGWEAVLPFHALRSPSARFGRGELPPGSRIWRWRATDPPVQTVRENVLGYLRSLAFRRQHARHPCAQEYEARLAAVPPSPASRPAFPLRLGDTVERHLRDGDLVLFNRQPTLHRGSMQALRVRVLPGLTMRFSLALTNAFNADFDGDEMNIFVPQSQQAVAELEQLLTVQAQFTTPQAARPIVNICQDELLAGYLMTRDGRGPAEMDGCTFMNLVDWDWRATTSTDAHLDHIRAVRDMGGAPAPVHCTYTLLSLLLPSTLEYAYGGVHIVQGVLVRGTLSKAVLGNRSGALVHVLYRNYGAAVAVDFVTRYGRLANRWLATVGFSVGVSDCVLQETQQTDAREGLRWCLRRAHFQQALEQQAHLGPRGTASVSADPTGPDGRLVEVLRERKTQIELNKATNIGQLASVHGLDPGNRLRAIVSAGSKGSTINIAQITSALGQQNVSGGRPRASRLHPLAAGRTLSYFTSWATEASMLGTVCTDVPAGCSTVWLAVAHTAQAASRAEQGATVWAGLPYPHFCTAMHAAHVVAVRPAGEDPDTRILELRLRTPLQKTVLAAHVAALFVDRPPTDEMESSGVWWVDPRACGGTDEEVLRVALRMSEARGFVSRSYIEGLSLGEFVFHAAGGREGVIDTALKTAETGYMQRKMIKTTEDIVVSHTGLVVMGPRVVSFATGDDGLDPKEGVRVGPAGQIQFADAAQLAQTLNGQIEYESWILRTGRRFPASLPATQSTAPGEDMWPRISRAYVDDPPRPPPPPPAPSSPINLQVLAQMVTDAVNEPYDPSSSSPMYNPSSPVYRPEEPAYDMAVSSPVYNPLMPAYCTAEYSPSRPSYETESPSSSSFVAIPILPPPPPPLPPPPRIAADALQRLWQAIRAGGSAP